MLTNFRTYYSKHWEVISSTVFILIFFGFISLPEIVLILSVIALILIGLILIYGRDLYLFFTIFSLLALVGELSESIRAIVQLNAFFGLTFLFLKSYGFSFKTFPKIPPKLIHFFLLLYFSLIVSTIFSQYFLTGLIEILMGSIFFLLLYLIFSQIRSKIQIYFCILAIIFSTLISSGGLLFELIYQNFDFLYIAANANLKTGGVLSNYNATAAFFAMSIPILFSLVFSSELRKLRLLFTAVLMIFIISILVTTSRSSMLAVFTSSVFILYNTNKKLLRYLILGLLSMFFLILIIPSINESVIILFRLSEGISQRNYLWDITLQMIFDNPIFGVGPGAWHYEMIRYFPVILNSYLGQSFVDLYKITKGFNLAHNFYLVFWSDMGILGLCSSIFLPYTFLQISLSVLRIMEKVRNLDYYLVLGLTAAGIGMFFRGFFEGISLITFIWITVDLPFWLIFAIICYYYLNLGENNSRNPTLLKKEY